MHNIQNYSFRMRKITTSLAVLAALFMTGQARETIATLQTHDVNYQQQHLEQAPFDASTRGAIVGSS